MALSGGNMTERRDTLTNPSLEGDTESRIRAIRGKMSTVERHDWWLWGANGCVVFLLMAGIYSLSLSISTQWVEQPYTYPLDRSIRGLLGLVCLFVANTIYQQVRIKRLRRELADQMDSLISAEIRADAFKKLSFEDPLTGLSNRRFVGEQLKKEIARAKRLRSPLTLLSVDVNNFKGINDGFGHPTGDLVLKAFGEHLKKASRGSDTVARIGGDEFLVVLPDCDPHQVHSLVERLDGLEVDAGSNLIRVGFAWGTASYSAGMSPEDLVSASDQALYARKERRV
jgi:diguanylate cyclase (GGDEF)-like protein